MPWRVLSETAVFGRRDDLSELATELCRELGRGGGKDAVGDGPRLVFEARAAGALPAVVGAGLAEARLPELAHVRAGVRLEQVVAREADLLDEVDGQRLPLDGDAAHEARDHADPLVGDDQLLERHLLDSVEEAGAEEVYRARFVDSVQQMSLEELVIADEVFG